MKFNNYHYYIRILETLKPSKLFALGIRDIRFRAKNSRETKKHKYNFTMNAIPETLGIK